MGDEDTRLAKKALDVRPENLKRKKPNLLVLDKINLALHGQLPETREALEFLDRVSEETDIVLNGRYAPKELLDRADFVNEVKYIKSPKETVTIRGIQY